MMRNFFWKATFIFICNLPIISTVVYADTPISEKQINVVLRYDDYGTTSSTELEIKILSSLKKKGVSCTFGVVPYPRGLHNALTQRKADILNKALRAGTVEVALHGLYHSPGGNGILGEFNGLQYDLQMEKIVKGKDFLERMLESKISTFIPPLNQYDLNTIKILENVDFKCISGNGLGVGKKSSSVIFLPMTCEIDEVRDAVKSARLIDDLKPIIVVLFHDYDFIEKSKRLGKLSFQEFDELLSWLTSQRDVMVSSIQKTIAVRKDLTDERYSTFRSYSKLYILIPRQVKKLLNIPSGVYLSSQEATTGKRMLWILIFLIYGGIAIVSAYISVLIGMILFPISRFVSYAFRYGGAALLLLLLYFELKDQQHGFIAVFGIAILAGAYIGTWICHLKFNKMID
jgi:hypothetical protein